MKRSSSKTSAAVPPTLHDVYAAPGHLVRRCHQISVALFFDEVERNTLTPVQYASLVAIRDRPGIEQKALVDLIAIDRTTIGTVLRGLEAKGLISRTTPADNLRIKQLNILPAGIDLLKRTHPKVDRVQERLLAPLSVEERHSFLKLLSRLVQVNNEFSRVPLRTVPDASSQNELPSDKTETREKANRKMKAK